MTRILSLKAFILLSQGERMTQWQFTVKICVEKNTNKISIFLECFCGSLFFDLIRERYTFLFKQVAYKICCLKLQV